VLYRHTPSCVAFEGVIWILATIVCYSAVLYGGWPYNYKFGGPRGEWWVEAGTDKQRHGSVAGGAPDPCRPSVACGAPPGALGPGARSQGEAPYPHRTTHWSRPPPAAAFSRAGVRAWGRRLTASVRPPSQQGRGGDASCSDSKPYNMLQKLCIRMACARRLT